MLLTAHETDVNSTNWKAESILEKMEQTALQKDKGK